MLLRRYSNIEYLYSKEPDDFVDFVKIAINKDAEEKLYQSYLFKSIFADKNFPTFDKVLEDAKMNAIYTTNNVNNNFDEWKQAEVIALEVANSFRRKRVENGNI